MGFDYAAAKESGASDREIIDYLSQSRGFDVDGALAAGASEADIALHMSSMSKKDETTTLGAIGEAFKRVPGLCQRRYKHLQAQGSLSLVLMTRCLSKPEKN